MLVEGMPTGNPNDGHGASDSLTGQGFGYYAVNNVPVIKTSVDQFVAQEPDQAGSQPAHRVAAAGRQLQRKRRPVAVLRRRERRQPADDRLAAVGVQHGVRRRDAHRLERRLGAGAAHAAQEHPRHGQRGDHWPARHAGQQREDQAGRSPGFHPPAREQAAGQRLGRAAAPPAPSRRRRARTARFQFMGDMDALAANLVHQQIIVSAFACDITRVACLEYGNDQKLMVNTHGDPVRRPARRVHPQRRGFQLRQPGQVRGVPGARSSSTSSTR